MGEHRHKKRKHEDRHSEKKHHHHHSDKKRKRRHSHAESSKSSVNDLEELRRLAKLYNKRNNDKDNTKDNKHTKEDYEKQRSVVRHEYDSETGRMRLVRGSGEILESLVSRDQHRQINKTATATDGLTYQAHVNRM